MTLLSYKYATHLVMVLLLLRLHLGNLYTASIVTPDQLNINTIANTPVSDEDVRRARSDLEVLCLKHSLVPRSPRSTRMLFSTYALKLRPVFSVNA